MHNPFGWGVVVALGSLLSVLGALWIYFDGMRLRKLGARLIPPLIAIIILLIQNVIVIQNLFSGVPFLPFNYFITKFSWLAFVLPWAMYLLILRPYYRKQIQQGNIETSNLPTFKVWTILFVFLLVVACLSWMLTFFFVLFARDL